MRLLRSTCGRLCVARQVRSLRLLLDESKKESRWVRERNQELERVVEALRKTIMRQAELASQRQDQQGKASYSSTQFHSATSRLMFSEGCRF